MLLILDNGKDVGTLYNAMLDAVKLDLFTAGPPPTITTS
jgi:hypothetical protein